MLPSWVGAVDGVTSAATIVAGMFSSYSPRSRFTRNLKFLVQMEDSGVDRLAADNPQAGKLTTRIVIMVSEEEADLISKRT
jgi:hypothetical protein